MENSLIQFVNTLDSSLKKLQRRLGDSSGVSKLTINQFHYIEAIYELDDPTITTIADKLAITKASVTAGINKLVKLGYVVKTASTDDRRVIHISLTGLSQQLIRSKYQALREYGDFIQATLTEDEAKQFETIIKKLVLLFK